MENLLVKRFELDEARQINPLTLALIGDAVFELFVRNFILSRNSELSAHKIHVKCISYVKASAQSKIMNGLKDIITDEEMSIYKRGRNTKSNTMPKNAEVADYRNATGFETLIGFLYVTSQEDRLNFILNKCLELI